ncbi:hypothetical protein C9374_014072 [Naegleria lovaniensis]|uniref:Transcription initiation factor TFIID subunit 1 histone acetyltransferase domain-containing protein n=1 Tax=Naegleria lovaniensis TaxID=51637 RepID=A0AA88GV72_NAELO|nr:uncharacterized protein C9374_014072 [Naegleria lovaniensis]KAG2389512.1 hypothetical protein C9374_014072 [Naegleria lovaniensis]
MVKKNNESNIGLSLFLGNYDDFGDKDMVQSLGGIGNRFGLGFIDEAENAAEVESEDSLISDEEDEALSESVMSDQEDQDYIPSKYILSHEGTGNPLLRFSELFGAKEAKKQKHKIFNMKGIIDKLKEHTKVRYNLEDGDDEEDVFFENDVKVRAMTKKISEMLLQEEQIMKDEEDIEKEQNRTESENVKQMMIEDIIAQRSSFHNLDQAHWENDIVWDITKKGEEAEQQSKSKQTTLQNDQHAGKSHIQPTFGSSILGLSNIDMFQSHHNDNKINQIPDLSGIPKLNTSSKGEWGEYESEKEEKQKPQKASPATLSKPSIPSTTPNQAQPPGKDLAQQDASTFDTGYAGESEPFNFADDKRAKRKYTRRKKKDTIEEDGSVRYPKSVARHFMTDFSNDDEEGPQFKFLNENLLNGEWLDDVYWDDVGPKPSQKLLLDMNDKSMFFVEANYPDQAEKEEAFYSIEQNIYNISNDSKYEGQKIKDQGQKAGAKKYTVKHSLPALKLDTELYRSHIPDAELRRLHHRRTKFKANEVMPVLFRKPKKEKKKSKKKKDLEKKQDLSANDHRVILMEYVEERPPLLNNVGMGTMIMNYYKKPNSAFEKVPECEDGIPIIVESEDSVPLITTLVDGEFVTTTENNMFRAQIYKNQVPSTDFLLCTRKSKDGKTKFYIREFPRTYTVGHTQPQVEVTPPRTRASESYTNNRLTLFIFRSFLDQMKKGKRQLRIKIDDIKEAFPDFPHQTIRERLKALATYDRGSGVWTADPAKPIPSEEELRNLVSPEMVCINESMLSGDLRLNDKGIDDEASMVAFELSFAKVEEKYRDTIRFIEREKIELPWDKTNNFHLCFKGGKEGVKLQLLSIVHQNITNPEKLKQLVDETEKRIQSEIEEILPSMTDTEAKRILLNNKYTEEQLRNMTRADRKMNARKILKQQGYQPGVEYNRDSLFDETNTNGAMDSNAIDSRKNAKDIARINIFKEVLQDVLFREAMKLENGLNFYETSDEVIDQLVEKKLGRLKGDKELELEKMVATSKQQMLKEFEEGAETGKKKRGRKSKQPSVVDVGKRYVKKTTFITNEDGSTTEKVEYIKNPTQVSYYESVVKGKRRQKHFLGATEDEVLLVGPKERGRLQALSREFKKKFRSDKQTASEKLNQEKKKRTTAIKNASVTTTRKQQTKQKRLKREQKKEEEMQKKEKRAAVLKTLDSNTGGAIIIPDEASSSKKKEKSKDKDSSKKRSKSSSKEDGSLKITISPASSDKKRKGEGSSSASASESSTKKTKVK